MSTTKAPHSKRDVQNREPLAIDTLCPYTNTHLHSLSNPHKTPRPLYLHCFINPMAAARFDVPVVVVTPPQPQPQQPKPPKIAVTTTHGGTAIDTTNMTASGTDVSTRTMAHIKRLIDAVNTANGSGRERAMGTMTSLVAAQWLASGGETYGFGATFVANAIAYTDLLHCRREAGRVVIKFVDARKSTQIWDATESKIDVDEVSAALRWAGVDRKSETSPDPRKNVAPVAGGTDLAAWTPRLMGSEDFVGLFSSRNATRPWECALVVRVGSFDRTAGIDISRATTVAGSSNKPAAAEASPSSVPSERMTYAQLASHPTLLAARDLARRNAMRLLHDALAALGFGSVAEHCAVPDLCALPSPNYAWGKPGFENEPPVRVAGDRESVVAALVQHPYMCVPDINCELDCIDMEDGGALVTLCDGVVRTSSAVGGLVALRDGSAYNGIIIIKPDHYAHLFENSTFKRFFDGGYTVDQKNAPVKTPDWMLTAGDAYDAVYVARRI
jgi:hypothetical protein